jgi:hypothetical protein
MTEAWLRGAVDGVPAQLMPAAHSLIDAVEDIERALENISPARVWLALGGAAPIGFHLKHVCGSLDRLVTYARGEGLTRQQSEALAAEGEPGEPPAGLPALLDDLRLALQRTLGVYRATDPDSLFDPRTVGRARLPSTVLGLLFHAAEHARRHAGQVIATARIIKGLGLDDPPPAQTTTAGPKKVSPV